MNRAYKLHWKSAPCPYPALSEESLGKRQKEQMKGLEEAEGTEEDMAEDTIEDTAEPAKSFYLFIENELELNDECDFASLPLKVSQYDLVDDVKSMVQKAAGIKDDEFSLCFDGNYLEEGTCVSVCMCLYLRARTCVRECEHVHVHVRFLCVKTFFSNCLKSDFCQNTNRS